MIFTDKICGPAEFQINEEKVLSDEPVCQSRAQNRHLTQAWQFLREFGNKNPKQIPFQ